jgi:hypothetical protein
MTGNEPINLNMHGMPEFGGGYCRTLLNHLAHSLVDGDLPTDFNGNTVQWVLIEICSA